MTENEGEFGVAAKVGGDVEFRRLLDGERVRMVRSGNLLRLLMGVLFLFLFVGQEFLWRDGGRYDFGSREAVVWLFIGYIGAAVVVWRVGCLSEAWAGRTFLAIPFLDMVMVLLRQWFAMGSYEIEELRHMTGFGTVICVGLIVLALTSLDWRFLLMTGVVAAGTQSVWKARLGATLSEHLWSVLAVGAVTGLVLVVGKRLVALVQNSVDERERRLRLNRFFSPQVVEVLEEGGGGELQSEGREVTVLFSDLRGFTALSQRLRDDEVVELLNRHHSAMAEVVFENGGTLDKFLGDGMLAYFGAPAEQADHVLRAVRCALEMQERMVEQNAQAVEEGREELKMGVGVHTGMVITGEIGPANRREYTAIGDTVNVASRIESLTKVYGEEVLVSSGTRRAIGDSSEGIQFTEMPGSEVRGVAEPVITWAVRRS